MERTAECHCGALRVVVSGEPERVYVCHCKSCQRRTGAVVHSGAGFAKANCRIEGESRIYVRTAESGKAIHFHFCPTCGSNVYWEQERFPDLIGIAVGAFADPDFPKPTFSVWEESRHDWVGLPDGLERFTQGRGA